MPLFSIVIANYNYGRYLEEALLSVFRQSCDDFELIVVDGGSTDDSVAVIKRYADRIVWWCSEPDRGQSDAFNKGFAHAHGKFLTWLNADDVLTPGALESIQVQVRRYPECEWFVGSTVWTDPDLSINRCFCAHRFSDLRGRWGLVSAAGPSSFFTKRLLKESGGFDVNLHYVMDTDLWFRFYLKCCAKYRRTRHNVWAYRQHEASKMSGADHNMTERAIQNRQNAIAESRLLIARYGNRANLRGKIAHLFSWSLIDFCFVLYRNWKWKGVRANEI